MSEEGAITRPAEGKNGWNNLLLIAPFDEFGNYLVPSTSQADPILNYADLQILVYIVHNCPTMQSGQFLRCELCDLQSGRF